MGFIFNTNFANWWLSKGFIRLSQNCLLEMPPFLSIILRVNNKIWGMIFWKNTNRKRITLFLTWCFLLTVAMKLEKSMKFNNLNKSIYFWAWLWNLICQQERTTNYRIFLHLQNWFCWYELTCFCKTIYYTPSENLDINITIIAKYNSFGEMSSEGNHANVRIGP